jgi:hypothetical protein
MKLNYHPSTFNSSVGILLYSKLYRPDRLVVSKNTTEYGIGSITSERNSSDICVHFMEMSIPANGLMFSLDQICGIAKLDFERTFCFKFILGKKYTNSVLVIIEIR